MKTVKTLLLGTAAGFMAIAGANAADLPGKAGPAEYVRVCDTYGAGFFFIPGTDTCLRIGGNVQVNYLANLSGVGRNAPIVQPASATTGAPALTGFRYGSGYFDWQTNSAVSATVNLDARSNTEYGMLRSFAAFTVGRGSASGAFGSGNFIMSGVSQHPQASNISLTSAFIQFAGFTFGLAQSFFNFTNPVSIGAQFGVTNANTTLLAYTAAFGSGFSATLSVENALYRRIQNADYWAVAYNSPTAGTAAVVNAGTQFGLVRPPSGAGGLTYGPHSMPDIVLNLRVDQGWGSAQIMGAIRQLNDFGPSASNVAPAALTGKAGDKFGFAVGAGLRLDLNMLSRGSVLWLQGAYTDGALDYVTRYGNDVSSNRNANTGNSSTDSFGLPMRDAIVAGGRIQTVKAWSLNGGFRYFWTPSVRSAIFGGYTDVNYPVAASIIDWKMYQVGINTIWSPVRNLDLGLEVVYTNVSGRTQAGLPGFTGTVLGVPTLNTRSGDSYWTGLVRVQRNF